MLIDCYKLIIKVSDLKSFFFLQRNILDERKTEWSRVLPSWQSAGLASTHEALLASVPCATQTWGGITCLRSQILGDRKVAQNVKAILCYRESRASLGCMRLFKEKRTE